MPDPGMTICENDTQQPDKTTPERSATRPVEDRDTDDPAVQSPLTIAPIFPPRIDYSSASNEIDGNVYLAYAFPRPRHTRAPNHDPPDYSNYPDHTHRATVVTWDRETGIGSLFEIKSGSTYSMSFRDIGPFYGALIVGTQVMFQMFNWKFHNFWVDDDRYYVLYREAAICEARYPYMRDENDSMDFDPNRDYFRCPRLDERNVNAHLEIYSMKHND